jgi:hypothetical protein
VLAVFNWPKNTDRYAKVSRFIEYLFTLAFDRRGRYIEAS